MLGDDAPVGVSRVGLESRLDHHLEAVALLHRHQVGVRQKREDLAQPRLERAPALFCKENKG